VAVLFLEDEAGGDEKLLAVPDLKTTPYYEGITEGDDLPKIVFDQIAHFFTHYKDLEPEKWTRVGHWGNREDAKRIIVDGLDRAKREGF
jgi:inorganic pyrophosphatase